MATRLKTVHYAFPTLAALVDNTLTSLTQITVYLPESSKTFKSVIAYVSADGTGTAAGNLTTRRIQCRLGAAGYTTHTNSNLYTGSAEDLVGWHCVDLTSHFNTNWSGTSMTMDAQVLMDGTWTGVAFTNVCVTVYITYEYDDTSTTQVKTVFIPLNAPVGAFATSKPGTATATIPNLSTELPEASKSFRSTYIVVQGNLAINAATSDSTISMELDATGVYTSGIHEGAQASDKWHRHVWDCSAVLDTNAAMDFFMWGSVARYNHWQAYLVITYEFDASASNNMFVSVLLPGEISSPMGGPSPSDYQRADRDFFIQEPDPIQTKQVAYYMFWDQLAPIGGLNARISSGSFVTYTDTATQMCGGNGLMIRNDSAYTFARGRNKISVDVYRTDAADLGYNVGGFWMVNYTSSKPPDGYGAANHTIFYNLNLAFDGAARLEATSSAAVGINLPESNYYITGIGVNYQAITNSTAAAVGATVLAQRIASEGGVAWEPVYVDIGASDVETGLRNYFGQMKFLFNRWKNDVDPTRLQLSHSRKYKATHANGAAAHHYLDAWMTYHTNTFVVSGSLSGLDSGLSTEIELLRANSGELVATQSLAPATSTYSFTWYDNTEAVFVSAYQDGTHYGRSKLGTAE